MKSILSALYENNQIFHNFFNKFSPFLRLIPYKKGFLISKIIKFDSIYWDWWIENEKIDRGNVPKLYRNITRGKGKFALDIGCGSGFYSKILKQNGYNVICADRSKKASVIIKNEGFKYEEIDINNNFSITKHYDLISCMGVLHHIVDDESVKNAIKIMKNNCDFLILGVRNDLYDSYKFKRRPISFYNNIVKGKIIPTDSYLDIIISS